MCDINIVLSILTAKPNTGEQFILSTSKEKIIFPIFKLNDCSNIEKNIYSYIDNAFINSISDDDYNRLFLIDINNTNIQMLINNDSINILYGMIIPYYQTINSYFWHGFSFNDLTIPNELAIIGETIRRGF